MRRFESTEAGASKFWEIGTEGSSLTVRFGKIGTAGQTKVKTLASPDAAKKEESRLIAEKTKKGYVETGADASGASPVADPSGTDEGRATSKGRKKVKATTGAKVKAKGKPAAEGNEVDQMLAAVRKKAKGVFARLAGPATPAELEELKALGAPEALVYLLSKHNGSEGGFVRGDELCSVANIREQRRMMNGLLDEDPERFAEYWQPEWIPFVDQGDGQLYCIDPNATLVPGSKGQILYYDHETGPSRSLESFDVWLEVVTKLAKKGLLDDDVFAKAEDEDEERYEALCEKYDALWAGAETVGLARMADKPKRKALKALPDRDEAPEAYRVELSKLVAEYGADTDLLGMLASFEAEEGNWELAVKLLERLRTLLPPKKRPITLLVTALHRVGRDTEALRVLLTADHYVTKYPTNYLQTEKVTPEFAVRAYQALADKWDDNFTLLETLMTVAQGDERRRAAEQIVARSNTKLADFPAGHYNRDNYAKTIVNAEMVIIEGLSDKDKTAAFTEFVHSQPKGLTKSSSYGVTLAKLALASGDWARVLEGANMTRYNDEKPIPGNYCALAVRAQFELGREEGALEDLSATARTDHFLIDGMDVLLPWRIWPAFEEQRESLRGAPRFGPLLPSERDDANRKRFERRCFEILAEVAPNEPYWRYGVAACAPGDARERELRELLASDLLQQRSTANAEEDQPERAHLRLELRVLVDLGEMDEALALLDRVLPELDNGLNAMKLVPFVQAELGELPEPVQAWMLEAHWRIGKSHPWASDSLVFVATHTPDPARRREALEQLVVSNPRRKEKDAPVDHFSAHIEALFENGREDDALDVLAESLTHPTLRDDGVSRLWLAIPFRGLNYRGVRSKAERATFLERWFGAVLAKFPDDPNIWCARAENATDPELRVAYLDEATKHFESPRSPAEWRKQLGEKIQRLR